jgi:hypothetical protein
MTTKELAPRTPITARADRSDRRVRLLEEAILQLRGQWPTAATGLCMSVNSIFGFRFGGKEARQEQIEESLDEALRLVEALYGPSAVTEVYRRAGSSPPQRSPYFHDPSGRRLK